jgi:thioredoxin 1
MLEVTDANYKTEIDPKDYAVVVFTAEWCGGCRLLKPRLPGLVEGNDDVVFGTINAETNRELVVKFGIRSLPAMIFLKKGVELSRLVGGVKINDAADAIKRLKDDSPTISFTTDF